LPRDRKASLPPIYKSLGNKLDKRREEKRKDGKDEGAIAI
jgi:hypothetical protein